MTGSTRGPDLTGFVVGVTADRRSDDQAVMFGRLGARVIQAPVLRTVKVPDPDGLRRRTAELIAAPPDYLIANTGIGMRTWMACAEEWGLDSDLRRALGRVRIATRGPKAAGALSSAGLDSWWRSSTEQLGEVVDRLVAEDLTGRRVAFQLHGDDGADVTRRLAGAGAAVATIPVYAWGPPADPARVEDLVRHCVAGGVDAVTFTAGPQVEALLAAADRSGRREAVVDAFNRADVVAGCIGPVCAASATAAGISDPLVPANWRLGSLVRAVAEALAERPRPLRSP